MSETPIFDQLAKQYNYASLLAPVVVPTAVFPTAKLTSFQPALPRRRAVIQPVKAIRRVQAIQPIQAVTLRSAFAKTLFEGQTQEC